MPVRPRRRLGARRRRKRSERARSHLRSVASRVARRAAVEDALVRLLAATRTCHPFGVWHDVQREAARETAFERCVPCNMAHLMGTAAPPVGVTAAGSLGVLSKARL